MDQRSMNLLEKAFVAEIEGGLALMQTRSKLAERLVEDGYLVRAEEIFGSGLRVTVSGYRLTHLGRITYCLSC